MKGLFSISLAVVLALCLSTLAFPANTVMAAGDDWYVAPTGNNTTGDGSEGNPWQTISYALSQANSGDTVYAASGNYSEDIVMEIGVTIQGAGANVTTIKGTGNDSVVYANNLGSGAKLDGFTITNGSAGIGGGGISLQMSSSPTISNCIITQNSASNYGGGIFIYYNSSPTIINCLITENNAPSGGGIAVFYSPSQTVTNCTITANSATDGGGIASLVYSFPTITNSIIYGNTATGNGPNIYNDSYSTTNVTYSCVEGGYTGTGNISGDPKFVPAANDYHLQSDSPCIDTGTSTGAPSIDLDGITRPQGAGVDMGAYEVPEVITTYTITATAGSGGAIAPLGEVSVEHSSNQTFTITPDPNYHIADVLVDTSSVGAVSEYTFSNVTDNHTIEAIFEVNITIIEIDIKPGSEPNSINLKSNGVIPVAILTANDFDATTVNPDTVRFGQASPVHHAIKDVDGDGDNDMILHFRTQETGIEPGDTEVTLTGQTTGGIEIIGTDSVRIVPPEDKDQDNNNPNPGQGNNQGNQNGDNPGEGDDEGNQNGDPNPGKGKGQGKGKNK